MICIILIVNIINIIILYHPLIFIFSYFFYDLNSVKHFSIMSNCNLIRKALSFSTIPETIFTCLGLKNKI